MSTHLDHELTELQRMILSMGASVERRLDRVVGALVERDYEAARTVRHGDRDIDEMDIDIEEACFRVLALYAPVASDLRFVLAVLRVNSDLERVGDLAKSIAKRLLDLEGSPAFSLPPGVATMATATRALVGDALGALANKDPELCQRIRRADDRIDDLQKEIFQWANREIPQNVSATESAINTLSIARSLERIADHATNIAEEVLFLLRGEVVRHHRIPEEENGSSSHRSSSTEDR